MAKLVKLTGSTRREVHETCQRRKSQLNYVPFRENNSFRKPHSRLSIRNVKLNYERNQWDLTNQTLLMDWQRSCKEALFTSKPKTSTGHRENPLTRKSHYRDHGREVVGYTGAKRELGTLRHGRKMARRRNNENRGSPSSSLHLPPGFARIMVRRSWSPLLAPLGSRAPRHVFLLLPGEPLKYSERKCFA